MYKIPASTLFMGKELIFVPECHSTNTELLSRGVALPWKEGIVVITDKQTAGRGQGKNSWESEAGLNLTFSVGLRPHFLEARNQFQLNMALSLGVRAAIAHYTTRDVYIKWPNDMMLNKKKICGLLIESQITGTRIQQCVVGIGLNVNQSAFNGAPHATSLLLETKKEHRLADVFEQVITNLESFYLQLRAGNTEKLTDTYLEHLYWRGEQHFFESAEGSFEGRIEGVDQSGRLLIRASGQLRHFDQKQVRFKL